MQKCGIAVGEVFNYLREMVDLRQYCAQKMTRNDEKVTGFCRKVTEKLQKVTGKCGFCTEKFISHRGHRVHREFWRIGSQSAWCTRTNFFPKQALSEIDPSSTGSFCNAPFWG